MFFPSLCMLGFSSLTMSFDLFCYLLSLPFFLLLLIYRTKKVFPCQATCCSMFLSWFCNTLNKNECFQSVRAVNTVFPLTNIMSNMCTFYCRNPIFWLDILFMLCTHPVLNCFITFVYIHKSWIHKSFLLEAYPGPLPISST